jgi:hypothetical protein
MFELTFDESREQGMLVTTGAGDPRIEISYSERARSSSIGGYVQLDRLGSLEVEPTRTAELPDRKQMVPPVQRATSTAT